jgi:AraC-like DNA-binding protein
MDDPSSGGAMLFLAHKPAPALAPFIEHLWCLQDAPVHAREHVLPAGTLELVINLAEDEFRIYDREHPGRCQRFAGAMVSGAYSRYFVIDTREHASIMGVHFRPGGALPFLGLPPGVLADTHVELAQLWGARAAELREQLCAACSSERRFELLEQALLARMTDTPLRPAARAGIALLGSGQKVGDVAKELSLSRRRFISVFSADVGTTPKLFARIQRFQRTLERAHASDQLDWSQLALACGYFDQSHMIRDFVDFAGLAPAALRSRGQHDVKADHVALAPGSHSSNTPHAQRPQSSQQH